MKQTALQRAIEAAGSPAKLAKHLGISAQAISQWDRVPPGRALKVAEVTGVPVEELLRDQPS
jgi:DNA-binding transcriptional regulator YdaS (Cro superfamily)